MLNFVQLDFGADSYTVQFTTWPRPLKREGLFIDLFIEEQYRWCCL
jgi:hypothetical protein